MKETIIKKLQEDKIIVDMHLNTEKPSKATLIVWGRKKPKEQFKYIIELAKIIGFSEIYLYIDDLCSRYISNVSIDDQRIINDSYIEFCEQNKINYIFSSQIIYSDKFIYEKIEKYFKNINLNEYIKLLPINKRENSNDLYVEEIIHTVLELILYEDAIKNNYVIITGKFSMNMIFIARKLFKSIEYIIIPKISNDFINIKLDEIRKINKN